MFKYFYKFNFFLLTMLAVNKIYYLFCQDCTFCCCCDNQQDNEEKKIINNKNINSKNKNNDFLKKEEIENEIFNKKNLLEEEYCLPDTYYQMVSFYPKLDEYYLDKDEEKGIWFIKQQNIQNIKDDKYKKSNDYRAVKTSHTCSSMIFINKNTKYIIGKCASDDFGEFPYGFLWDLEKNSFDKNSFCVCNAYSNDYIFEQITNSNECETYFFSDGRPIILFGSSNKDVILKIAKNKTIGLAKKIYDIIMLPEIQNIKGNKEKIEKTLEILNDVSKRDDKDLVIDEKFTYNCIDGLNFFSLSIKNKEDEKKSYCTNIRISFKYNKISFGGYNEVDIKNNNGRMYFNNLIVDINAIRKSLLSECYNEQQKEMQKQKAKCNLINFINIAKKIGTKDLFILKDIEENEKKNIISFIDIKRKIKKISFDDFINKYAKEHLSDDEKLNLGINN